MKDLIAKIGGFCENHVEKIVLVLVGAVCVWLFFTRVIFSPNVMMLGRTGKAYTPGQIDRYIFEQKAQELRVKLQEQKKGGVGKTYAGKLDGPIDPKKDTWIAGIIDRPLSKGFQGLFDSPLGFINATLTTATPGAAAVAQAQSDRKYRLPLVPDVTDVGVNLIRAAAYVPLQEINLQTTYDKAAVEPNDIDLVTVEGRFDVAELYRRFRASFAGVDVQKEEWRDPCLAQPIFAAVQLERQELADDGRWMAWQPMPRSRVEANRERFRVYEKISDLPPGGLGVRLMQFKDDMVTSELLQPEAYQIASAEEEWFPPSFYGKFKDLQRKVEAEKRRDESEKNRKQTTTDTRRDITGRGGQGGIYGGGIQGGRGAPGSARGRNLPGGMQGGDIYGGQTGGRRGRGGALTGPGGYPGQTRSGRRGGPGSDMYGDMYGMPGETGLRRKTSTNEVYFDFYPEMITFREDLSKRTKPLLIWVFDDTVEPGKTYQYRVRVGVFNPVAGTGEVVERDESKKDQVILWSPYSEITKPVDVQQRTYLFARDVQNRTNTATVEVARYALGYWRTESFQVQPGETIGKEMEPKKEDDREKRLKDRARMAGGYGYGYPGGADRITGRPGMPPMGPGGVPGYGMPLSPDQQNVPKTIDYDTGKVLVDLVQVNDWGNAPNLRPRLYYDMLYTGDGTHLEHMPVSAANWPKDVAAAYQYVQTEKRREPQPFRAFNKGGLRGRGRGGRGGMEGYEDMGMYDEMGGGYGDYGGAYGGEGMYPY
jgi:hypothetical protein